MVNQESSRPAVTLLALDLDAALAPQTADPAAAKLDPAAAEFLTAAAGVPGIVLAIASELDVKDLVSCVGSIPAYLIASDGLEIRGPQGKLLVGSLPLKVTLTDTLRRFATVCGFRLEETPDRIALYWSGVPYLHEQHPVIDVFRAFAAANELEVIEGEETIQLRRHGIGKEAALRWVTSASAAERVIFAADDPEDAGALRFAAENGKAFLIATADHIRPEGVTVVGTSEQLIRVLRDEVVFPSAPDGRV